MSSKPKRGVARRATELKVTTEPHSVKPLSDFRAKPEVDDRTDLDRRLAEIKSKNEANWNELDRAHKGLYMRLGHFHDWHVEARQTEGYLEKQYKTSGIEYEASNGEKVNYTPAIKLAWSFMDHEKQKQTISQWNIALRYLDLKVKEMGPDYFQHNSAAKKAELLDKAGGIAGAIEEMKKKPRGGGGGGSGGNDDQAEYDILSFFKTLPGSTTPTEVGDGLAVVIARKDGDNTTFLYAVSNSDLVRTVAEAAINDNTLDPNLRTIVEIVQSQAYPVKALPANEDKRQAWLLKNIYRPQDKSERTINTKILSSDGQAMLLTHTKEPGVVTRCVPKKPIIKRPAYIAEADVLQLEMWEKAGTKRMEDGEDRVSVTDLVTQRSHDFMLHPVTPYYVFDDEAFKPDWEVKLTREWFDNLNKHFPWFTAQGQSTKALKEGNKIILAKVTKTDLTLEWNHDGQAINQTVKFPVPLSRAANHEVKFLSMDLAPVLYNLARVRAIDAISMGGNAQALVIRYQTTSGAFEIAIPTLGTWGERQKALFRLVGGSDGGKSD